MISLKTVYALNAPVVSTKDVTFHDHWFPEALDSGECPFTLFDESPK